MNDRVFDKLIEFLQMVPAVNGAIGHGTNENGSWWVKFKIDIHHQFAWQTIQEFGHVLNYLSLNERLPTSFYPVSPPPYMNGGPTEFLSWIIESEDAEFKPEACAEWLKGRLPDPVSDLEQWAANEDT